MRGFAHLTIQTDFWLKTLLSLQPFSSGRQVVVERHNREQGLRKEWHGGSSSQERGFPDNRRMGDSRGSMMAPSRYTRVTNGLWQNMIAQLCSQPSYTWALFVSLQSLFIWTEPNCTDHQQLYSQWRQRGGLQALQRNAETVLTASKFCHFEAAQNLKTFLNSLFLVNQLF